MTTKSKHEVTRRIVKDNSLSEQVGSGRPARGPGRETLRTLVKYRSGRRGETLPRVGLDAGRGVWSFLAVPCPVARRQLLPALPSPHPLSRLNCLSHLQAKLFSRSSQGVLFQVWTAVPLSSNFIKVTKSEKER